MKSIHPLNLIPDEKYYIQSVSDNQSRQIAICKQVSHIAEDKYVVYFSDISEIKKNNGYGHSGLHHGDGSRHSYWFTFYKVHSVEYNKKIEILYKKAINTCLQQITCDCNFVWYT